MICPVCRDINLTINELSNELTEFTCSKCNGNWIRLNDYLTWLNNTNKDEYELLVNNELTSFNLHEDKEHIEPIFEDKKANQSLEYDYIDTSSSITDLFIEPYRETEISQSEKEIFSGIDFEEKLSPNINFSDNIDNNSQNLNVDFITIVDSKRAKLCPDCGRILIKYKVNNSLNFYIDHCCTCSGIWFDKNKWNVLKIYNLNDKVYRFFTDAWQKRLRDESTKKFLINKYENLFGLEDFQKIKDFKKWIDENDHRRELIAFILKSDPYKIH